ncbi:MAG: sigma-70 family RNA polymerase sigma factor [Saprospiraceae bacterium]|jgi:RNA polymerase sigma factor (sigma-70 family)|nr:sigma-70 family RNA polymerase sigma factor [Saprospiraceae bacterium]
MKAFETFSDLELIQKIEVGEIELFELIIRRYNPFLYRTGRSYNYNHEDTQDLMQDTFIDAFRNLSKFENRSSFKTWLIKIMLNNCYKNQHKWGKNHIISSEINQHDTPLFSDNTHTETFKAVMNRELNFVIEQALQQIPIDYRIVFTLREVNGMNVIETADALNISESNVKVRLNRAKSMLRKEVEKSYSPEDIFEFNLMYCDGMVRRVMKHLT